MRYFKEKISEKVWESKYRYRMNNAVVDQTIEDTWRRVAKAVSLAEKPEKRDYWEAQFFSLMQGFRFLPGGRILAGAGTKKEVTLFNCFVMSIAQDSLGGIFKGLEEGAHTLQQGGGVGYDFSILRPYGQIAHKAGVIASGPVSFMRIWDSVCATMQSTGARRGAMMGTLRCDHPDIELFIDAKADPKELRHFNVSVLITDDFMKAVRDDDEWLLVFPVRDKSDSSGEVVLRRWSGSDAPIPCEVYRRLKARYLWDKIIRAAYEYAEPGVIYIDTINRMNNLHDREWISATNPCGEIPLPSYGACDLGSINLTQFVLAPFTKGAKIDWDGLEKISVLATRFLDNVIDVSHFPLSKQREEALKTRRIGLGIAGLADVFVMLGVRYGDKKSVKIASKIMKTISHATWRASIDLGKEKGSFLAFDSEKYLQSSFVQGLPSALRKDIARYGVRNSHHNTIAPTGTISLLANNISSGIEPIFGARYQRRIRGADAKIMTFDVTDYAYSNWSADFGKEDFPPAWIDAPHLKPNDHLKIQAAVQPYIDNAISKTIYIPEDFSLDDVKQIYGQAYKLGLKGCTIFRPNPVTGSVLTAQSVEAKGAHCGICGAIYTRRGDLGETDAGDSQRLLKCDERIMALGDLDELNCAIGVVITAEGVSDTLQKCFIRIQHQLFELGAELCGAEKNTVQHETIDQLEQEIDQLDRNLPDLQGFILPGGGRAAANCHMARAICRRAERAVSCLQQKQSLNPCILKYLNRLSDWLFIVARVLSKEAGIGDNRWQR